MPMRLLSVTFVSRIYKLFRLNASSLHCLIDSAQNVFHVMHYVLSYLMRLYAHALLISDIYKLFTYS